MNIDNKKNYFIYINVCYSFITIIARSMVFEYLNNIINY